MYYEFGKSKIISRKALLIRHFPPNFLYVKRQTIEVQFTADILLLFLPSLQLLI